MNTRISLAAALATLTAIVFPMVSWGENEIGFVEKFALAADREKALRELVPGSESYYYYHALHYQNTRNAARLAEILEQWKKRFPNETAARRIIENREALLEYEGNPQKTIGYLKERLGATFEHQREVRDKKSQTCRWPWMRSAWRVTYSNATHWPTTTVCKPSRQQRSSNW